MAHLHTSIASSFNTIGCIFKNKNPARLWSFTIKKTSSHIEDFWVGLRFRDLVTSNNMMHQAKQLLVCACFQ